MTRHRLSFLIVALLAAGCALVPSGATPRPTVPVSPTPNASPTNPASPAPTPTASPEHSAAAGSAFYLRGYYTQSIPPQYTFSWLPPVTIADGEYINGNVAVPAIYPGPLMIVPISRSITAVGTDTIAGRADELGLLDGDGDFTDGPAMPGSRLVNIDIVVDYVTHHLVGPEQAPPCDPAACLPGTTQAFATFWNQLLTLDNWLPNELGHSGQYVPERVALMLNQIADPPTMSPRPALVAWPLDNPLADTECLTLEGEDLATMLPVLESATQLTAFYEDTTVAVPQARVLVPGEPALCAVP